MSFESSSVSPNPAFPHPPPFSPAIGFFFPCPPPPMMETFSWVSSLKTHPSLEELKEASFVAFNQPHPTPSKILFLPLEGPSANLSPKEFLRFPPLGGSFFGPPCWKTAFRTCVFFSPGFFLRRLGLVFMFPVP